MGGDSARGLISMGLEVDSDSDGDGTLASERTKELIDDVDPDLGLLEILSSLISAAEGAAEMHASHPDTIARLSAFAYHIKAARKEIR